MQSAEGRMTPSLRHIAMHTAILVDAGKQPTQAKATGEVGQARALFHQYETAIPNLLELGTRHADRSGGCGIESYNCFRIGLDEEEAAAVAQERDAGQRRVAQPPPICAIGSRPKPKCLGAAHHFGDVDAIAAAATNFRLVRVDAVEPQ